VKRPQQENHVLVTGVAPADSQALLTLSKRIAEAGLGVLEARASVLGSVTTIACYASGSWDSVAKLETALSRIGRDEGMSFRLERSAPRELTGDLLPYLVEVVAADRPGALHHLAEFFATRGITIEQLSASRYQAAQTGAEMFSAQVTIGIPSRTHIAALRDDFLEFCDAHNLDAIMDPVKF
jgi:glycine cleavage system transcriptional repressor